MDKKQRIILMFTFDENNGDNRYAGHTLSLFPCRWSKNEWKRCSLKKAERLAIYSPFDGSVSPFFGHPEEFGTISTWFVEE